MEVNNGISFVLDTALN